MSNPHEHESSEAAHGGDQAAQVYRDLETGAGHDPAIPESANEADPEGHPDIEAAQAAVDAASPEHKTRPDDPIHAFIDELNERVKENQSDIPTHGQDMHLSNRIEGYRNPRKREQLRQFWGEQEKTVSTTPYQDLAENPDGMEDYVRDVATRGNRWAVQRNRLHVREKIEGLRGKHSGAKRAAESDQLGVVAEAAGKAAADRFRLLQSGEPIPDNPSAKQAFTDIYLEASGQTDSVKRVEADLKAADTDQAREHYSRTLANAQRSHGLIIEQAGQQYDEVYGDPKAVEEMIRLQLMTQGPAQSEWQRAAWNADEKWVLGRGAAKERLDKAKAAVDAAAAQAIERFRSAA